MRYRSGPGQTDKLVSIKNPKFTKGNYVLIAKVLNGTKPTALTHALAYGDAMAQWERTCLAFLNQFKQDNPNFDGARFLLACSKGRSK